MLISPNDREDLFNAGRKITTLQLNFVLITLLLDQDDLADHRCRHKRNALEVKHHLAVRFIGKFQQFATDPSNESVRQNLLRRELDEQNIILVLGH